MIKEEDISRKQIKTLMAHYGYSYEEAIKLSQTDIDRIFNSRQKIVINGVAATPIPENINWHTQKIEQGSKIRGKDEYFQHIYYESDSGTVMLKKTKEGIENDKKFIISTAQKMADWWKDKDYKAYGKGVPTHKVVEALKKLDYITQSPYGYSYYNSEGISWGRKPEGSIRLADHWGWEMGDGKKHCEVAGFENETKTLNKWLKCVYVKGKYYVMEVLE